MLAFLVLVLKMSLRLLWLGKVGYRVLPPVTAGGDSYTGHWMWGYGIPANAQNPEAAWYFIQYMSNKANAATMWLFSRRGNTLIHLERGGLYRQP